MHTSRPLRALVAVTAVAVVVGGCSSSTGSSTPSPSGVAGKAQQRVYLAAVNGLCDTLLTTITSLASGGNLDITAGQYLQEWPAHQTALQAFDRALTAVPEPPAARPAAKVLRDYIELADDLDAARLKAAHRGQRAFRREIAKEKNVESDPRVKARNAAGFAPSCDAR